MHLGRIFNVNAARSDPSPLFPTGAVWPSLAPLTELGPALVVGRGCAEKIRFNLSGLDGLLSLLPLLLSPEESLSEDESLSSESTPAQPDEIRYT